MQTEIKNCNQTYILTDKSEICCSYESKLDAENVKNEKMFRHQSLQEENFTIFFRIHFQRCAVSFQAEVESSVASSQAGYVPKRNATTQTSYQVLTEEEIEMHLRHPDLPRFLQKVLPEWALKSLTKFKNEFNLNYRFEKILIENAQWDIFKDDWNTKDGDNNNKT